MTLQAEGKQQEIAGMPGPRTFFMELARLRRCCVKGKTLRIRIRGGLAFDLRLALAPIPQKKSLGVRVRMKSIPLR